jgi:ubiquitin-protein ligase
MSQKRIHNEMKRFPQTMATLNMNASLYELDGSDFNPPRHFGVFNQNKKLLQLTIPPDYPFKSPKVLIMNKEKLENYDQWSRSIYDGHGPKSFHIGSRDYCNFFLAWVFSLIYKPQLAPYWKFIPSKKNDHCLCCESITCSNNWSPSKTISDILMEFIARRNFFINCSPLMQRWIKPIFDNDRWSLPEDIILLLISNT